MVCVTLRELVRNPRFEVSSNLVYSATIEQDSNQTSLMTLRLNCRYPPPLKGLTLSVLAFLFSIPHTVTVWKKKYPTSFISIERKFADSWAVSDPAHHLRYFSGGSYSVSKKFYIYLLSFPSFMLQRENYITSFFPRPHLPPHRQENTVPLFPVTKFLILTSAVTDQYWICFILKVLRLMTYFVIIITLPFF
jgi:hypothetical protein